MRRVAQCRLFFTALMVGGHVVRFIAQTIPRKPNLILFGSAYGRLFTDNPRHLALAAAQHAPEFEVIWMYSADASRCGALVAGLQTCRIQSVRGLWLLYRAAGAVFSNSLYDFAAIPTLVPSKLYVLNTRHGRSIKRVRYARKEDKISWRERWERRIEAQKTHHVLSTSEFISRLQEECLLVGSKKHLITGYPRNDSLLPVATVGRSKRVLYAPTWRHGREPTRFFPGSESDMLRNVSAMESVLEECGAEIYLRPHANDLRLYGDALWESIAPLVAHPRVHLLTHEECPDVHYILGSFDVLISDYSAIIHDFLLLERPIIVMPYDHVSFSKTSGFLYDLWDHAPGTIVSSSLELFEAIRCSLTDPAGNDESRARLQSLIHKYVDRQATKRVWEHIMSHTG